MSDDGRRSPGDHGPLGVVRGLRDVRGHPLLGGHIICLALLCLMYERYVTSVPAALVQCRLFELGLGLTLSCVARHFQLNDETNDGRAPLQTRRK